MTDSVSQIRIQSGEAFTCSGGVSILDSALQAGIVLEYSCKTGLCGVCKTQLISGEVEEIQVPLSLSEQEREAGLFLTCCSRAVTDVDITAENLKALQRIEVKTLPAKISGLNLLTEEIIEVTLRFPPTTQFKFLAGQYVDIAYNGIRRSYSIASAQDQVNLRFLIKKVENGLMSDYWFNAAKGGDLLRIEGPKGTFFYRHEASNQSTLLLATGTGIAPMLSMLKTLDQDKDFMQQAPIYLFWGNRQMQEFDLDIEFDNLDVQIYKVLSTDNQNWAYHQGYVQDVALETVGDVSNHKVYACGSNAMIQSAKALFIEQGLKESDFHSDAFVQSFS